MNVKGFVFRDSFHTSQLGLAAVRNQHGGIWEQQLQLCTLGQLRYLLLRVELWAAGATDTCPPGQLWLLLPSFWGRKESPWCFHFSSTSVFLRSFICTNFPCAFYLVVLPGSLWKWNRIRLLACLDKWIWIPGSYITKGWISSVCSLQAADFTIFLWSAWLWCWSGSLVYGKVWFQANTEFRTIAQASMFWK